MKDYSHVTLRGKIIYPFEGIFKGYVSFKDGSIVAVGKDPENAPTANAEKVTGAGSEVLDFSDCYISPGFIDLHVHGGGGADFIEATADAVEKVARFHAAGGTTGLLATVLPMQRDELLQCLRNLAQIVRDKNPANFWGLHLEGPFVNDAKKGALEEQFLSAPDLGFMDDLAKAAGGILKMVTIAPELKGADALVKYLVSRGIIVSAGHTESSAEVLSKFYQMGLRNVTHFYNAMVGFHHRMPGTVGGVLLEEGLMLDVIPEENHVHPDALRLAWKLKGPDRISIITDCTSPGGMSDGQYRLGGKEVDLTQGVARLRDGTLAGSTITMIDGIKYLVERVGLRFEDAVGLAATNPARLLGLEDRKGRLRVGADADVTVFDDNFKVQMTVVGGRIQLPGKEILS